MNTEYDILMNMYVNINSHLEHIQNFKTKMLTTIESIKKLDNNYFDVKCNEKLFLTYINMFTDIDSYEELISGLEELKYTIDRKIKNICIHEWVYDYIDITPDSSQPICYCSKCEITKK